MLCAVGKYYIYVYIPTLPGLKTWHYKKKTSSEFLMSVLAGCDSGETEAGGEVRMK